MGTQKALLEWGGSTLIEYQLGQLSRVAAVHEIVVVTGHEPTLIEDAVKRFPKAKNIRNAAYRTGKVSSILTGLGAIDASSDAIVLLAVDQPRPSALTDKLIREHNEMAALITVPVHAGRRGHPVVFSRRLLPELRAISESTLGIRAVLQAHDADVQEIVVDDPEIHVDLNRPADVPEVPPG